MGLYDSQSGQYIAGSRARCCISWSFVWFDLSSVSQIHNLFESSSSFIWDSKNSRVTYLDISFYSLITFHDYFVEYNCIYDSVCFVVSSVVVPKLALDQNCVSQVLFYQVETNIQGHYHNSIKMIGFWIHTFLWCLFSLVIILINFCISSFLTKRHFICLTNLTKKSLVFFYRVLTRFLNRFYWWADDFAVFLNNIFVYFRGVIDGFVLCVIIGDFILSAIIAGSMLCVLWVVIGGFILCAIIGGFILCIL